MTSLCMGVCSTVRTLQQVHNDIVVTHAPCVEPPRHVPLQHANTEPFWGPASGVQVSTSSHRCNPAADNPWLFYHGAKPHCRIRVGTDTSPLNVDRLHARNLTDCMQYCQKEPYCKAITYSYSSTQANARAENCWLKTGTAPTQDTPESDQAVTFVSVFKPDNVNLLATYRTCEDVKAELQGCGY